MTNEVQANWRKLLDNLKTAKKDGFDFDSGNWTRCAFGVFAKYSLNLKGQWFYNYQEDGVCRDTEWIKQQLAELFGIHINGSVMVNKHPVFADDAKDYGGPKNIDEAIDRVEVLVSQFTPSEPDIKEIGSMKITLKSSPKLAFPKVLKGETFKHEGKLFIRVTGSHTFNALCFNTGALWEFRELDMVEPVSVEVIEL